MENSKQNTSEIIHKIRNYRKNKGYSHDFMALELNISPSTYTKIERNEVKLSLERFLQISQILEVSPSLFLENQNKQIIIQNNSDFENAYVENQQLDKDFVASLKDEILFLRKLISENLKIK